MAHKITRFLSRILPQRSLISFWLLSRRTTSAIKTKRLVFCRAFTLSTGLLVKHTDEEWRAKLTPQQYHVCRQKGTEPPWSGEYNTSQGKGIFQCVCCGADLFSSSTKFDSGSGWPSFYDVLKDNDQQSAVKEILDKSHGMVRVEVLCKQCDSHLGHVFSDGPPPTELRYCINSVALKFKSDRGTLDAATQSILGFIPVLPSVVSCRLCLLAVTVSRKADMSTEEKTPFAKEVIKEHCPAFKDGCPYKKLSEELFIKELEKCPAFAKGCPFKDAKSIEEIKLEMAKMPETKHHEGVTHQQLLKMLQSIHEVSKEMEQSSHTKCPVFETEPGCPFKSTSLEGKPLVEPPSAILSTADLAKLKELCPAFKEGCPFAKMDNEALLKEIKKCPEFKDGCAFKDSHSIEEIYHKLEEMPSTGEGCHHRDVLLETMKMIHGIGHAKAKECPVLEKLGCPFKGAESGGKPLIEPQEAVLPQVNGTHAPEDLKSVNLTTLRETCPAFDKGCPFAQIEEKLIPTGDIKKCPEFKDGCPFKGMESMAEVYEKLSKIPAFSGSESHGANLLQTLKEVHNLSKELKEEMGECPVFANDGCPFKTICSDGRPLVEKLEFRRWTQVLQTTVQDDLLKVAGKVADAEPSIQLSKELKKGTKVVHREAENVHFVKEFIKGRIESYWYRVLLADLYFVYKALEEESRRHKDNQYIKAIHFPHELERTELIKEDLAFYYGEDWQEQIQLSDATKEYVDRLKKIGDEDPILLIPHHYTRYLGDLSGGLILKKMATKAMDLPSTGEGVRFYCFDNVAEPKKFKNVYRSQLDKLQIDKDMSDKIVEEANLAFMLNIKIFREIDALAGYEQEESATTKTKSKVESEPEMPAEHPASDKSPELCPFATMAKNARKEQENRQGEQKVEEKMGAIEQKQQSSMATPLILAFLVAAAAVVMAMYALRN